MLAAPPARSGGAAGAACRAPDPDYVLRGHRADVQALAFHPALDLLYAGDADGQLIVWDLQRRRPIAEQRLHSAEAGILSLHVLGTTRLLSQGREGTMRSWSLASCGCVDGGAPDGLLAVGSYNFCRASVAPACAPVGAKGRSGEEGSRLCDMRHLLAVAGSDAAVVQIWDVQAGQQVAELRQPRGMACGMCMAVQLLAAPAGSGGPWAVTGYEDGTLALWDAAAPARPVASVRPHTESVMALAVDASGRGGVSGAADSKLALFDVDCATRSISVRAVLDLPQAGVADVAIRADNRVIASGGWDNRVRVFSYQRGKPLAVLIYHRAGCASVAFRARDGLLASGARDCTIALWSLFPTSRLEN